MVNQMETGSMERFIGTEGFPKLEYAGTYKKEYSIFRSVLRSPCFGYTKILFKSGCVSKTGVPKKCPLAY